MSKSNLNADNKGHNRGLFATRLGVLAATVGSAVGLGNIWRFPYEAGMHGGSAFLIIYILFVLVLGIPAICAEFVLGRSTRQNAAGAFRKLGGGKFWPYVGIMGIICSFLILGFYTVVAGWTLEYLFAAPFGEFNGADAATLHTRFDELTTGWCPILWTLIFLTINFAIIGRGVQKGIEKLSNILMPILFLIIAAFAINSLMMPGAKEGLTFLFHPDFSQITSRTVISAMGQAFFSLSVGMGVLMTYASYFSDKTPLAKTACTTALLDTLVAIMSGVIIFPAVFSFGQQPEAGPRLVFEVLPAIFGHMAGGTFWATLFFLLLFAASVTSTISLSEVVVAYFIEEKGMSRRKAIFVAAAGVTVLAVLSALSFGPLAGFTIGGLTIFNLLDFLTAAILMPLGGMLICIYAGWKLKKHVTQKQLLEGEKRDKWLVNSIIFCLRFIAPAAIAVVFIFGLL